MSSTATSSVSMEAYRLAVFNTPESGTRARCERDRTLATCATARLRQLVAKGGV